MPGLPQLIEEDVQVLNGALDDLLRKSEATVALILDKGGPVICERGNDKDLDTTTVAALAAGSFCATQAIAQRLGEETFDNIYQQGKLSSLLMTDVDENLLLIVVFKAAQGVGVVKFYAAKTATLVAAHLQHAYQRAPDAKMDLVALNLMDVSSVFKKKE